MYEKTGMRNDRRSFKNSNTTRQECMTQIRFKSCPPGGLLNIPFSAFEENVDVVMEIVVQAGG